MKPYATEVTGRFPESKHAAERVSGPVYHKTIEKVERAAVRRVSKKRARRFNRMMRIVRIIRCMTDPKTSLRDIAEQACIFDRAHFDDDVEPIPEAIVSNHEQLPSDRKLITRLRPRHAVALGFFEGYVKAVEAQEKCGWSDRTFIVEHLRALQTRIDIGVHPMADAERLRARLTKAVEDVIAHIANIGIVKKPPPPPPPAAPPKPNELCTEIDDELVQAAADYANKSNDFGPGENDIALVNGAVRGRGMSASTIWNHDARGFVEGARWQLSQIERAHAGDDPTMYHPPIVNDGCVVYWDNGTLIHRTNNGTSCPIEPSVVFPSNVDIVKFVHELLGIENDAEAAWWSCERLNEGNAAMIREAKKHHGPTAQACTIKLALLHFFAKQSLSVESAIPMSDDVAATELPKVEPRRSYPLAPTPIVFRDDSENKYWDEMTFFLARKGDTTAQSVACAADEMVEERRARQSLAKQVRDELGQRKSDRKEAAQEITDELLLEAASYANGDCQISNNERDLACAKEAMTRLPGEWYRTCRAYVEGALRKARKP